MYSVQIPKIRLIAMSGMGIARLSVMLTSRGSFSVPRVNTWWQHLHALEFGAGGEGVVVDAQESAGWKI